MKKLFEIKNLATGVTWRHFYTEEHLKKVLDQNRCLSLVGEVKLLAYQR